MAALVGIAPNLRAILASHVAFQFVDGGRLGPAHDVQSHRLACVATKTANLKIEVSGVQGVNQAPGTAGQVPCIQACADSKPRTPAGQLPCELPWRVQRMPGSKSRK
jgi:hypothetical protein